jgi:sterol desaturase/sphingolipid hydroxylase (fatty acid hydroxylase superfamily)
LPLVPIFVIYDFFYTALHWFLHLKSVYPHVHKHHHVQKAPSRANVDAINVHPLEFFLGEYNHLLALWLCCRCVCQVHVVGSLLFLVVGAVLAGINHTRYDVTLGYGDFLLFDSKAHDVHHRIPQSNYGQYIMLWDVVFGTFRYVHSVGRFAMLSSAHHASPSPRLFACFFARLLRTIRPTARTIPRIASTLTLSSIRQPARPLPS